MMQIESLPTRIAWQVEDYKIQVNDSGLSVYLNSERVEVESKWPEKEIRESGDLVSYFEKRLPKIIPLGVGRVKIEFQGPYPIKQRIADAKFRGNKIAILMRHGERNAEQLSEWGKKSSTLLGKSLIESGIEAFYTSSVPRCVNTALGIIEGIGREIPIAEIDLLVTPFHLPGEDALSGKTFSEKGGTPGMIKALTSRESLPGFMSIESGVRKFIDFILSLNTNVTVMTSHDFIITAIALFLTEQTYDESYIANYLEGFFIEYNKDQLIFYYRDKVREISIDNFKDVGK